MVSGNAQVVANKHALNNGSVVEKIEAPNASMNQIETTQNKFD